MAQTGVERPKRKCDWAGLICQTLRELQTAVGRIPIGTTVGVHAWERRRNSSGASGFTAPCECCGVSLRLQRMSPDSLRIIERVAWPNTAHPRYGLTYSDEDAMMKRMAEIAASRTQAIKSGVA